MTWTILVLVLGVAIYLLDSLLLLKKGGKKTTTPSTKEIIIKKSIKAFAVILIAGATCRMFTPYYLTSVNPMILQDMVQSMQNQKAESSERAIREYVEENAEDMMKNAVVLGNPGGTNTIFIWTDHSCPYCRRVEKSLEDVVKERKDVRVVIKNFVVHGPLSDAPARAVIAAKLQDPAKAAELHTKLMSEEYYDKNDLKDQSKLDEKVTKSVMNFAKKVGLDTKKLAEDMKGDIVAGELKQVRSLARMFDINGTPFLIINDKSFPGAISYDQIIDALK